MKTEFLKRDFGVEYAHLNGTFEGFESGTEKAILTEISVCTWWIQPTLRFFAPHQVVISDKSSNKYFSSILKTREDMLDKSFPFLNAAFWGQTVNK